MKSKISALAILLLAVFMTGCEKDRRNDNLYDSAVYFVNNATAGVYSTNTMYDVQESVEVPIYVYLSGFFGGTTTVSMTMDEEFLALYNESHSTELKLLPDDCYRMTRTTATVENRKGRMAIEFDIEALKAFSQADDFSDLEGYVVPLALQATEAIPVSDRDALLGYELVQPVLSQASMSFSIKGNTTIKGTSFKMTMESLFENSFDIDWNIEFESASIEAANGTPSTARGNSLEAKYARKALPLAAISDSDINSLAPGENSVTYEVTMPEGTPYGVYYLNVKVNKAMLNGAEIPIIGGDVDALIRFEYLPEVQPGSLTTHGSAYQGVLNLIPQSSTKFFAESYAGSAPASNAIDGSLSTIWENRYSSSGAGPTSSIPFVAVFDLGAKQKVNVLEVWRRDHSTYVTDLKAFEIYAAETVNTSTETFGYDGLTYLGTMDFGGTSNKNRAQLELLDEVETQYLVLKFTQSNRTSCISIAEICAWKR